MAHADTTIIGRASEQAGLVTRTQLYQAGLTRHVIDGRLRSGLLRTIHRGVYQVGAVAARHARELAALHACPGGAISHRTAEAVWEMLPPQQSSERVDVTTPPHYQGGRHPGVRVHRQTLAPDEIVVADGLRVTSRARTILDSATGNTARELERAFAHADRCDPDVQHQLAALLQRYPRRRGAARVRQLLDQPAAFTRSEAEERMLALIRRSGLPQPEVNVVVRGYEVDCYWRAAKLVLEVDGFAFHASHGSFVRDRQRDSALGAAGIRVLRFSWHQIANEQDRTLVQLAQALARV